ncbi:hypothetical protein FGM00_16520 [Aggregatimonas sangjinii]|uniref:PEGA domain-containing protein n=1 Tax=Aggregatimonas sangjinii TaxID=2583587 RepID=A0A5B7SSI9_9FLAO|nr:hypothetical protein [Aggregatimonas sangjinii]QCX01636.1 hypothetical protein FGM00_16520 [Aggregatimonas sangjinii]
MKKLMTTTILLLFVSCAMYAGKKKVQFSTSEQDANVFVDGKLMGKGNVQVLIAKGSCVNVRVEKTGFLTYHIEFCNQKKTTSPPKSYYMEMHRDDAYDASVQTDIANVDIEIRSKKDKDAAWRLMNQIVLSYLDVIETTDKETGYLRTAWQLKTFKQNTIRTRIIVKEASLNPLSFKVKLVSEESRQALTSVKSDELYREWDRVLRKYKDVVSEMQSRL